MCDYVQNASQIATIRGNKIYMLFGKQALLFNSNGVLVSDRSYFEFDCIDEEILLDFPEVNFLECYESFKLADQECKVYTNRIGSYLVVVQQDNEILGYKFGRPHDNKYSREFASGLLMEAVKRTREIQDRLNNVKLPTIHKNRRVSYGGFVPCPYCGYDIRIDCNYGEYYRKPECDLCGKVVRIKINTEIECWLEDFAPKKGQKRDKLIEQYQAEKQSIAKQ